MKAVISVVNKSRWILWIYAGGFLLGAAKHGYEILRGGFLPYTNAPFAFNLYWTSLVALDLLVVVLVLIRPRWGTQLAVAVMISDMAVDLYAADVLWHQSILTNIGLYEIFTFGLFVLITAPRVWKQIKWNGPQPAPKALWALIHSNFPTTRFYGIYNRRNIAETGTPSLHAEGRALDIGLSVDSPSEKLIGDELFCAFIEAAQEAGLQEIIWNRQIWSSQQPYIHPYVGADPHTGHIHVGFTREGSQRRSIPRLSISVGAIRTGLEDLSKAQQNLG